MGNNCFGSKKNSYSEKKEKKCKHKSVLHKIFIDIYILLSHRVFRHLQIISINAKGFENEEKVLHGKDIKIRNKMRTCR